MSWGVSPGLRSDRDEKTGWFAVKTAGAVSTEGNAGPGDVRGRDRWPRLGGRRPAFGQSVVVWQPSLPGRAPFRGRAATDGGRAAVSADALREKRDGQGPAQVSPPGAQRGTRRNGPGRTESQRAPDSVTKSHKASLAHSCASWVTGDRGSHRCHSEHQAGGVSATWVLLDVTW